VSGLAKGVYVVAIHTPAGIATKRLVVGNWKRKKLRIKN
jgi:hypothetical protein